MRHPFTGLLVLATLVSVLAVAGPAAAAPSCGRQVIDDWYDDGRVDGTYSLHCYDDAIEILPRDVRVYSSAEQDIRRALQARLNNEESPPATTDPSPDEPGATPPGREPPTTTPDPTPPAGDPEVAPPIDGDDSASSVPIPLLILAGLALLLVAGGSAGYLVRRYQSRHVPPPAV
jgi:hypothetical protein